MLGAVPIYEGRNGSAALGFCGLAPGLLLGSRTPTGRADAAMARSAFGS